MRRFAFVLAVVLWTAGTPFAASNTQPLYDEAADARTQIASAVALAGRSGKNVVLVFGANWCGDCHDLDAAMRQSELATLIAKNYVVVHIDVGRFDRNLDVASHYGVPIRKGIPALAVLNPQGKPLYAQDQGQFANASAMSFDSFKSFFERWKPKRQPHVRRET